MTVRGFKGNASDCGIVTSEGAEGGPVVALLMTQLNGVVVAGGGKDVRCGLQHDLLHILVVGEHTRHTS